jgi:hypothetical protein
LQPIRSSDASPLSRFGIASKKTKYSKTNLNHDISINLFQSTEKQFQKKRKISGFRKMTGGTV